MTETASQILGSAIGIAISPVPIISVIIILLTSKARSNSIAYISGWFVGLVGVILLGIGLALLWQRTLTFDSPHSDSTIYFLLGGAFFLMFVFTLWQQPKVDDEDELPAWADKLEELTPIYGFGLGFIGSALTPKNLLLTLGATFTIIAAGETTLETLELLVIFLLVASIGILLPIAIYFLGGDRSKAALDRWKVRLLRHRYIALAIVFLMLSIAMISEGLSAI